jgi:hypothetical protein
MLRDRDPQSDAAVLAVCEHFQVGRVTAINQLRNIGRINDEERTRMLQRRSSAVVSAHHPDADVAQPGLHGGTIRRLTLRALAAGKIDSLQAHSYLDLDLTVPLPEGEGLTEQQRAPLHDVEARVRKSSNGSF